MRANSLFLGVTKVDLFSLDIEGAEFSVLETIEFDTVDIKHIYVESDKTPRDKLLKFMKDRNYYISKEFPANILFSKRQ